MTTTPAEVLHTPAAGHSKLGLAALVIALLGPLTCLLTLGWLALAFYGDLPGALFAPVDAESFNAGLVLAGICLPSLGGFLLGAAALALQRNHRKTLPGLAMLLSALTVVTFCGLAVYMVYRGLAGVG
jgi:hypothetical protein